MGDFYLTPLFISIFFCFFRKKKKKNTIHLLAQSYYVRHTYNSLLKHPGESNFFFCFFIFEEKPVYGKSAFHKEIPANQNYEKILSYSNNNLPLFVRESIV